MIMKKNRKYFISVEGETEKWYFEHLQYLINHSQESVFTTKFVIKVNKSPKSFVKTLQALYEIDAFHICDYESNEQVHVQQFERVLKELKEAKKIKNIIMYSLGYCNYAFELWIILHKRNFCVPLSHRNNYLSYINSTYNEKFQFLSDYKEELNFKRLLAQIDLNDVKLAIQNANRIREYQVNNGAKMQQYAGFSYYTRNPDITINECVMKIFQECGLV